MSFSEAAYATLDWLRGRKRAYQIAFGGNDIVLRDLAKFCRATDTTFNPDQRLTDVLIGRHEVWLRIQRHLNLSSEQLMQLYAPTVGDPND